MKNLKRIALIMGIAVSLSAATSTVSYGAAGQDKTVENAITGYNINGIEMNEEQYQQFMKKMNSCKTKEDYYDLYNSYGMDTSELDKVYAAQAQGKRYYANGDKPGRDNGKDIEPMEEETSGEASKETSNEATKKTESKATQETSKVTTGEVTEGTVSSGDAEVAETPSEEEQTEDAEDVIEQKGAFVFEDNETGSGNLMLIMAVLLSAAAIVVAGVVVMSLKKKK